MSLADNCEVTGNINTDDIKENFQDVSFGASKKNLKPFYQNNRRSLIKLMAVPEVAEDSWASAKRTPVVGGNWKSNGDRDFISTFPKEVLNKSSWDSDKLEVCVAPTDIHLSEVQNSVKEDFNVMAQNVSRWPSGAFTGNITAHMLKDIGVNWALTGHSERRTKNGTTDQDVAVKTKVAIENGMTVMACIGEGLEEREMGKADKINARQLQAIADEL